MDSNHTARDISMELYVCTEDAPQASAGHVSLKAAALQ